MRGLKGSLGSLDATMSRLAEVSSSVEPFCTARGFSSGEESVCDCGLSS